MNLLVILDQQFTNILKGDDAIVYFRRMGFRHRLGHGEDTWEVKRGKGVNLPGDLGGGRMEEHWFNSAVGIYAKELAEHNGIKIYMAQAPYAKEVPLKTRTDRYNARKVKGVVSIHANAGSRAAHGACAFYWGTAKDSKRMAERWVKHAKTLMSEVGLHGNGLHAGVPGTWTDLHICRETNMKAILVENGFMTNANDIKWLLNDSYRRDCAEAIVRMMCEEEGITFKPLSRKGSTAPSKPAAPSLDKADTYTIKKGDTIWSISNRIKGVSMEDIMTLNPGIDPTDLKIGQVIQLTKQAKETVLHVVQKGDTLWSIAKQHRTTVKAIQNLNKGLDPHALSIGSKIKVDASATSVVKPAPAKKPDPKPVPKPNTSFVGKRVESKVNGLRFYNQASWSDKYVVGHVDKGYGFPYILSKHKVENGYQYRVKNSKGKIFYITASDEFVVVK